MPPDLFDALVERAPPRYTTFALPSYRFVPGAQPHPVADPRGHSYRRPARYPVTALDGSNWRGCCGYLYGCDLYNRGFWWEGHEAWEALWHLASRGSSEYAALQGLVQLANCHLKLYMGRLNAVSRLRWSYGAHFDRVIERVGPGFLGLDVATLRAAANAYIRERLDRDEPAHAPAIFPYLCLPVDEGSPAGG